MKLPCRFLDSLAETNKQNAEIYVGLTHVLVYHFLVIKWFKINLSITDKTKKKIVYFVNKIALLCQGCCCWVSNLTTYVIVYKSRGNNIYVSKNVLLLGFNPWYTMGQIFFTYIIILNFTVLKI